MVNDDKKSRKNFDLEVQKQGFASSFAARSFLLDAP